MATSKPTSEIFQIRQDVPDVPTMVRELNGILSRISTRLNKMQGTGGDSQFGGPINMAGNKVTNLGDPASGDDAQKKKLALSRGSEQASWDAQGRVITNGSEAVNPNDVVTLGQAKKLSASGSDTFADIHVNGALDHNGTTVGFYGVAPTTRPAAYTQTHSATTRTHSNPTALDFTDNSTGTPSETIAAITGGGAACENATKDAVASLARQSDRMVVDLANVKQVVNQILDDLSLNGLLQ